MIDDPQLLLWVLGGATYISGCLIYIFRFPERKYPGRFDLIVIYNILNNFIRAVAIRYGIYLS